MKLTKDGLFYCLLLVLVIGGFYFFVQSGKIKEEKPFCDLKSGSAEKVIDTTISVDEYLKQIENNVAILNDAKISHGCMKPEILSFILNEHPLIEDVEINPSKSGIIFHRKDDGSWSNYLITKNKLDFKSSEQLSVVATTVKQNLPISFEANYISFQNYSFEIYKIEDYPRLESWVENGEIECDKTPLESSLPLRISKKEINGKKYCIGAFSEGAAGSTYTEYAYTTVIEENVYVVKFVARYPNCSNYPDEKRIECDRERESFNLDNLVDQEIERVK